MLQLFQIEDVIIHLHPNEDDPLKVSAKTERAYNDAFNFYWSEAEFDTVRHKVSGYLLPSSRHLPSESIIRKLRGLIGRPVDVIAYDPIHDATCCCFCNGGQEELLWLHTMGMIMEVNEEWDDREGAFKLELVLERNPVWIPLNRFFWDFTDHRYNLFRGICFEQDATYSDDLCTGGTPDADTANGGNVAASAFDDNAATYWQSTNSALPHWLEYDFGADVTIRRYTVTAQSQLEGWTLEYYNGTSWQVADQRAGEPVWVGTETRIYDLFVNYTAQRWRININANGGGTPQVGIYELTMHEISSPASDNYIPQLSGYPRGYLNHKNFWVRRNYEDQVVAYNPDLWEVQHSLLRDNYPKTGVGLGWQQGTRLYTVYPDKTVWSAAPFSLYAFTNLSGADDLIIEVKRETSAWSYETRRSRISLDSLADAMLPFGGILPTDILVLGDVSTPPGFMIREGQILVDDFGKPSVVPEIDIDVPFGRLGFGVNTVKILPDRTLWAAIHTYRRY